MREKELRLALICYGGISLAVYMHGITKEIWHLARASRNHIHSTEQMSGSAAIYYDFFTQIERFCALKVRVLPDIIAGASAGGINGIFLAQAITTGQSLEPLTKLWLERADIEQLLDPAARRKSLFSRLWAAPLAKRLARHQGIELESIVSPEARAEVQAKLAHFVGARWFAPPFGGQELAGMLLDALDAMAATPMSGRLLPAGQPLDLFVTVTDFFGYKQQLKLNSPKEISETEHRLNLNFRDTGAGLGEVADLIYAARATASFPGAFPPFTVRELDEVLAKRKRPWIGRAAFLKRVLPPNCPNVEEVVLIDGSVLANAPFKPAIAALKDRSARREVDRRFVYIDPTPGGAAIGAGLGVRTTTPGFFTTIMGAISGIPREQPIHDSLEALDSRSGQIRRMQKIIEALRPDVEAVIERLFGMTLFLDRPTPARLNKWRKKTHDRATKDAGFTYAAYGHVKLSGVIEECAALLARRSPQPFAEVHEPFRKALWSHVRGDHMRGEGADGRLFAEGHSAAAMVSFFRAHDLGFRIRRLRFVAQRLAELSANGSVAAEDSAPLRATIYAELAAYLDRESLSFYEGLDVSDPVAALAAMAARRDLLMIDAQTDATLATALSACPKDVRRVVLLAYLGFPFYDIATLPLLQGEGLGEFDPIRVDRIAPDDATALRKGGAKVMLKGIEFHNFGAFFSRAYRENDYLWGRLHGADRLIDILASTIGEGVALPPDMLVATKRAAFKAILDEERERLKHIPDLLKSLEQELG